MKLGMSRKIVKGRLERRSKDCTKNDIFVRAFEGRLGMSGKERLVDHVLGCAKCRMKFDALRSLSQELRARKDGFPEEALSKDDVRSLRSLAEGRINELEERPAVKKANISRLIPSPILAAAAALLLVAVGLVLILTQGSDKIYRRAGEKTMVLFSPRGRLAEAPSLFTWSPLQDAETYKFRLVDDELNTLFSSGPRTTRLILPQDVRLKLARGKTYVWQVQAMDDQHNILGSGIRSFTIQ